jgi:hypothetical protein
VSKPKTAAHARAILTDLLEADAALGVALNSLRRARDGAEKDYDHLATSMTAALGALSLARGVVGREVHDWNGYTVARARSTNT